MALVDPLPPSFSSLCLSEQKQTLPLRRFADTQPPRAAPIDRTRDGPSGPYPTYELTGAQPLLRENVYCSNTPWLSGEAQHYSETFGLDEVKQTW